MNLCQTIAYLVIAAHTTCLAASPSSANIAVLLNQRRERPLVLGGCFLICGASGGLSSTTTALSSFSSAARSCSSPALRTRYSNTPSLSGTIALAPRTRCRSRAAWRASRRPGIGQQRRARRRTISSASVRLQRLRLACRSGARLIPILATRHGRARPGSSCLWTDILHPL